VIVVAVLASLAPAFADKRVALVVGNAAYRNIPRLDNPANDAKLMAETLRGLGFTLVGGKAQLDLDKAGFDSAVQNFSNDVQGADVALFYYAGHGVQVRGSNYLVPVAANPVREADVFLQMVDIALVLSQMEGSGTKLNLVILDACRNNPFGGRGLRSADGGLAQMRAPEGTLISFATQPGNVALDGRDGNSPYTKALAATLRKPGLGIFDAFNEVGLTVKGATGNAQQPWLSTSPIAGSFYFTPPAAGLAIAPSGPSADEIAWDFVKDSQDAAQLRRFAEQFPGSSRRGEALSRLGALAQKVAARPASETNVPAGSRRLVLNFDGIDARGRDPGVAANILSDYLARFGVTLTPQGSTRVAVFDDRDVYGGVAVKAASGSSVFLQQGGQPASYTLSFAMPLKVISLQRVKLVAGPSGITHPTWKAVAQDAGGKTVATVGEEELRSMSDIAAKTLTLSGPGIRKLVITGDHRGFAAFSNAVLESLVLTTE
jgi:hypothetical protein